MIYPGIRKSLAMLGALAAVPLAGAVNPAVADPVRFAPTSAWNVDYAEDMCALRRFFGNADRSFFLELRQRFPARHFEVALVSNGLNRRDRNFRAGFIPGDEPDRPHRHRRLETDDGWEGYEYSDRLDPLDEESPNAGSQAAIARDRAIEGYLVENGFEQDVLLETGPMNAAMAAMQQCTDNLVASWGFDPEEQRALERKVDYPDGRNWLRSIFETLEGHSRGNRDFSALLLIGADGHATRCVPHHGDLDDERNAGWCAYIMEELEFRPALDRNGEPIASYLNFSVSLSRS